MKTIYARIQVSDDADLDEIADDLAEAIEEQGAMDDSPLAGAVVLQVIGEECETKD